MGYIVHTFLFLNIKFKKDIFHDIQSPVLFLLKD